MPDDLEQLLAEAATTPDRPVDPDALIAAGRRRRRRRRLAVGASVAAVVALVTFLGLPESSTPVPDIVDTPSPGPTTAEPTPTPSGTPSATASSLPDTLDLDALPAMADHGVAVDAGDGVVLVDVDGPSAAASVGRLPGWAIDRGTPGMLVAGPVPLVRSGSNREVWLSPAAGTVRERTTDGARLTTPLVGPHEVVEQAQPTDPAPLQLVRDGEVLATFSPNLAHMVSDGHRVVSWADCPSDAGTDLGRCAWRAYDADMGGELELPAGCQVADALADLNLLSTCRRFWAGADGQAWLEVRGPGDAAPRRVAAAGSAGGFRNAFFAGDRIVATWEQPPADGTCWPSEVVAVPDGADQPTPFAPTARSGAAMVIGTIDDAVVTVEVDDPCFGEGPAAGHVDLIEADGSRRRLYSGLLVAAEVWDPWTDLDTAAGPEEPDDASDATPACLQEPAGRASADTILVYLGCGFGPDPLRAVTRERADGGLGAQLQLAVSQFAQGPTAGERARDYRDVFPGDADLLAGVELLPDQGTVVVDLDPAILEVNNLGTAGVTLPFVDGLRATVFQFEAVEVLRLEVGGACRAIDPIGQCTFREGF